MTNKAALKSLTMASVIAMIMSFTTVSYAQNMGTEYNNISDVKTQGSISKKKAQEMVKTLLRREYNGFGYRVKKVKKIDGKWAVTIEDRDDYIATAYVDDNNGNIHISYKRRKSHK